MSGKRNHKSMNEKQTDSRRTMKFLLLINIIGPLLIVAPSLIFGFINITRVNQNPPRSPFEFGMPLSFVALVAYGVVLFMIARHGAKREVSLGSIPLWIYAVAGVLASLIAPNQNDASGMGNIGYGLFVAFVIFLLVLYFVLAMSSLANPNSSKIKLQSNDKGL